MVVVTGAGCGLGTAPKRRTRRRAARGLASPPALVRFGAPASAEAVVERIRAKGGEAVARPPGLLEAGRRTATACWTPR